MRRESENIFLAEILALNAGGKEKINTTRYAEIYNDEWRYFCLGVCFFFFS